MHCEFFQKHANVILLLLIASNNTVTRTINLHSCSVIANTSNSHASTATHQPLIDVKVIY